MSKHRTPEQWQALVEQQGIGYASFCNWRKRLSNNSPGATGSGGSDEADFLDLSSLMGASPGRSAASDRRH